jgi:hypothetical protein
LNIYKTAEYTAHILTDTRGFVLDMQIIFKPTSDYSRRIQQRAKRYKQKMRVELPEDGRTNAANEAGAWL